MSRNEENFISNKYFTNKKTQNFKISPAGKLSYDSSLNRSNCIGQDCGNNLHFFTKCLLLLAHTVSVAKAKQKKIDKGSGRNF
jgi:hypothetical protein